MVPNEDSGADETGDSGEELGDSSVTEGESIVDVVSVGEDLVESDINELMLARCNKEECSCLY